MKFYALSEELTLENLCTLMTKIHTGFRQTLEYLENIKNSKLTKSQGNSGKACSTQGQFNEILRSLFGTQ